MNEIETITDTHRSVKLARKLFDRWGVTTEERDALLLGDLSLRNDVLVSKASSTKKEDFDQRCNWSLHIHRCLRLLFPGNRVLVYSWIKTPNRAFGGSSPLQLIINEGAAGYEQVIRYLDNAISR